MMIMEKLDTSSPTTKPSSIRWRDPNVEEQHDNRFSPRIPSQKLYREDSKLTDPSVDVNDRQPTSNAYDNKRQNGVPEDVFVAPVISRETSKLRTPGFNPSRNSLRSRARPRKSFEPTPFLSVDNLPPGTSIPSDQERPVQTSGKPRRSPRRPKPTYKPYSADPYFSYQIGRGAVSPPRSPRLGTTPSNLGRMTPIEFYNIYKRKKGELKKGKLRSLSRASSHTSTHSRHSYRSPTTLAGPPTLWSLGNRYWPKPVQYASDNPIPPLYAADPANKRPNAQVAQPFKHGPEVSEENLAPDRIPSPSQEMKELTAIGILEVSRTFARQRVPVTVKKSGRLLKARLKPLQDFKAEGPTIYQCQGVVAQKRDHSASQKRMQQRKKELLSQLQMKDIKFERLKTQESIHRTSIASEQDLAERDQDFMHDETQVWVNRLAGEYPPEEDEITNSNGTLNGGNQNIHPNSLASGVSLSEIVQSAETVDPGTVSNGVSDDRQGHKVGNGFQETNGDVLEEKEEVDGSVAWKDTGADESREAEDQSVVAEQPVDARVVSEPGVVDGTEKQEAKEPSHLADNELGDHEDQPAGVSGEAGSLDGKGSPAVQREDEGSDRKTEGDNGRVVLENIEETTEASNRSESEKRSLSQGGASAADNDEKMMQGGDGSHRNKADEEAGSPASPGSAGSEGRAAETKQSVESLLTTAVAERDQLQDATDVAGSGDGMVVSDANMEETAPPQTMQGSGQAEPADDGKVNADGSFTESSQDPVKDESADVTTSDRNSEDGKPAEEKEAVKETSQEIATEQVGADSEGATVVIEETVQKEKVDVTGATTQSEAAGEHITGEETVAAAADKGNKEEEEEEPDDADDKDHHHGNDHSGDKKDDSDPSGGGDAGAMGGGGSQGNGGDGGGGGGGSGGNDGDGNDDKKYSDGDHGAADEKDDDSTQEEEEDKVSSEKLGATKVSSDSDEYCDFCGLDSDMCVCPNSKATAKVKAKMTERTLAEGSTCDEWSMGRLDDIEIALQDLERTFSRESKPEAGIACVRPVRPRSANVQSHRGLLSVTGKKSSLMSSTASSRARQRPQSAKCYTDNHRGMKDLRSSSPSASELSEFSELEPSSELDKIVSEYKEMFGHPETAYYREDVKEDELTETSVPSLIPDKQKSWLDHAFSRTLDTDASVGWLAGGDAKQSGTSKSVDQSQERVSSHDDPCDSGHASEAVSLAGDKEEEVKDERQKTDAGFSEPSQNTNDSETKTKTDSVESQPPVGKTGDSPEKLTVVATTKALSKAKSNKADVSFPIAPFPPLSFRINAIPPTGKVYYFAYGADMNPNRMTTYIGRDVEHRLWGILFGFRLRFNKKGSDLEAGGFPNIECDPARSVEGCVYLLDHSELSGLDRFMGYPEHYTRVVLPVWMINCHQPNELGIAQYCIPAVMYVAQDKWTQEDDSLHYDYSLSQCLKGSDILSESYRDHLSSLKPSNPLPPIPTTVAS